MNDHVASDAASGVDLGPLDSLIGYLLRRAQIEVFQDFHRSCAEVDIRPAQFSVLTVLRHNPGLRQSQVGDVLGIQRTNFVPLFDTLERRGLAERRRVPTDRRALALFLTPAGDALLDRLAPLVEGHEQRCVARIGVAGKQDLLRLLRALLVAPEG